MLITGLIIGCMSFLAIVILVEKLPKKIKPFVLGHHLLADIFFTALAFIALPMTGATTLLSASTFCLLFTLYIFVRRSTYPWKQIQIKKWKIQIIKRD